MIDINAAANIAEIAGGIAILVSLLYVGYQVRQSNRIASATALQSILEGFTDRTLAQSMEHPETIDIQIRGHYDYDKLSVYEQILFGGLINRDVINMQNVMQFYEKGLVRKVDYDAWLSFTVSNVVTPGGRTCWEMTKVSYTPTITRVIEDYMKANPNAPSVITLYPSLYSEASLAAAETRVTQQSADQ
ncbi:MAG: hypothetical protein ACR2PH_09480 [Desulfobulbia bacterium]